MDLIEQGLLGHRHPWELSRMNLISWLIKNKPRFWRYADIGAGDQFYSSGILPFTDKEVYAVDTNYREINNRGRILEFRSCVDIPDKSIDCALLMDVLEHVDNEIDLLTCVARKTKDAGTLIITVPAFQSIYSSNDVYYMHRRRYNLREIQRILNESGFKIQSSFYFYTHLLVVRIFSFAITKVMPKFKIKEGLNNWRFERNSPLTKILLLALDLDILFNRCLSKINLVLPGLSLCVICKKN